MYGNVVYRIIKANWRAKEYCCNERPSGCNHPLVIRALTAKYPDCWFDCVPWEDLEDMLAGIKQLSDDEIFERMKLSKHEIMEIYLTEDKINTSV